MRASGQPTLPVVGLQQLNDFAESYSAANLDLKVANTRRSQLAQTRGRKVSAALARGGRRSPGTAAPHTKRPGLAAAPPPSVAAPPPPVAAPPPSPVVEEREDDDVSCVVCLARPREVVILPCRHLSLCAVCAAGVSMCPMCRGAVEETMLVFV